jgi:hypothetical protein
VEPVDRGALSSCWVLEPGIQTLAFGLVFGWPGQARPRHRISCVVLIEIRYKRIGTHKDYDRIDVNEVDHDG